MWGIYPWYVWAIAVVCFVGCTAYFTWQAYSTFRLRKAGHDRANILQYIVLLLELIAGKLGIETTNDTRQNDRSDRGGPAA